MQCTGVITSIRAWGYCPSRPENSTVVLQIFNSTIETGRLIHNNFSLTAECNSSAPEQSYYQRGYVSSDNISIQVQTGGHLSVRVNPNCSGRICFFQPATTNITNDLHTPSFHNADEKSSLGESLLFFVTIRSGIL